MTITSNVIELPDRELAFDGACPFVLCHELASHTHPVCRACNTVGYGNYFNCARCRERVDDYRKKLIEKFYK